MSYYHLFKRTVKSKKGKPAKKWYYWWLDPVSKIKIQKVCKGAKNQEEAFAYISQLPPPVAVRKTKIKDICKDMFVPDSEHMYRLSQLGKKLGDRTLQNYNRFKKIIIDEFGEMYLEDLTVQIVHGFYSNKKINLQAGRIPYWKLLIMCMKNVRGRQMSQYRNLRFPDLSEIQKKLIFLPQKN